MLPWSCVRVWASQTLLVGSALPLVAVWLGCARDGNLDRQVDRIGQLLIDAERSGALRCAPRQLAIARSQLEFAQLERQQGFTSRAERHLVLADQSARAAKLLSPPEHCRQVQEAAADGE